MRAGKLDRRILILQNAPAQDASGQEVEAWVPMAERAAQVVYDRSSERFTSQQVIGFAPVTFRMRFDSATRAITVLHRIDFNGREFDIQAVREIGRREGIEVDAKARGEHPVTDG